MYGTMSVTQYFYVFLPPPELQGRKGKKGMVSCRYEPVTKRHSAVVCPDGTPDAVTINHATPQITLYSQDPIRSCHRVCSLKSNVADRATFTFGNHRFTIHRGRPQTQEVQMTSIHPDKKLLTIDDVQKTLSIGRTRVFALIASGQLPSVLIGSSRRIPSEAVDQFIQDLLLQSGLNREKD